MKNLEALLKRFTNSLNKDNIAREAVGDVVFSIVRVKLSPPSISLKEGVLSIQAGAAAKNEMKLKEDEICEALENLHNIHVSRIIFK